ADGGGADLALGDAGAKAREADGEAGADGDAALAGHRVRLGGRGGLGERGGNEDAEGEEPEAEDEGLAVHAVSLHDAKLGGRRGTRRGGDDALAAEGPEGRAAALVELREELHEVQTQGLDAR